MRLSDLCFNDDCGKPKETGHSFIFEVHRYDFCSDECMRQKLKSLCLVNGHKHEHDEKRFDVV